MTISRRRLSDGRIRYDVLTSTTKMHIQACETLEEAQEFERSLAMSRELDRELKDEHRAANVPFKYPEYVDPWDWLTRNWRVS